MPYNESIALQSFNERLKQIDELLEAREILLKFNKVEQDLEKVKNLGKSSLNELPSLVTIITKIVDTLKSKPSVGRREYSPINSSAYVLLIAFFQGYIEDLYCEKGLLVLKKQFHNASDEELKKILKGLKPIRSNPHSEIINKYFANIGIYQIMDGICWKKQTNKTITERLKKSIEIRNQISHGSPNITLKKNGQQYEIIEINKQHINNLKDFLSKLAQELDKKVSSYIV